MNENNRVISGSLFILASIAVAFILNFSQPIIIYCSGGDCELSMHLGNVLFDEYEFEKILIFDAGFPAWEELGYPVE